MQPAVRGAGMDSGAAESTPCVCVSVVIEQPRRHFVVNGGKIASQMPERHNQCHLGNYFHKSVVRKNSWVFDTRSGDGRLAAVVGA